MHLLSATLLLIVPLLSACSSLPGSRMALRNMAKACAAIGA